MLFGKEYNYSLIQTTSKEALKRSALLVCGNDIKKATEIYEYFAKDLKDLPDFDPIQPTEMEQLKNTAVQIFNWGKENQDQLIGIVNLVRGFINKGASAPADAANALFNEVV